jgi:hypothetical protein
MSSELFGSDNSITSLAVDRDGNIVLVTNHSDGTQATEVTHNLNEVSRRLIGLQTLHLLEDPDNVVDDIPYEEGQGPNLGVLRNEIARRDYGTAE